MFKVIEELIKKILQDLLGIKALGLNLITNKVLKILTPCTKDYLAEVV